MNVRNAIRRLILVASVVYGVGVCLLWARSHYRSDEVHYHLGVLFPATYIKILSGQRDFASRILNSTVPIIPRRKMRYLSFFDEDALIFDQLEALGGGTGNDRFVTPICWRSGRYTSGRRCGFSATFHTGLRWPRVVRFGCGCCVAGEAGSFSSRGDSV